MAQQKMTYSQLAGMNLKRILKENGITQDSFAESCLVDSRTVRRWIKNGIGSIDAVALVADELGVSFSDMFSNEDDVPSVLYEVFKKQPIRTFLDLPVAYFL